MDDEDEFRKIYSQEYPPRRDDLEGVGKDGSRPKQEDDSEEDENDGPEVPMSFTSRQSKAEEAKERSKEKRWKKQREDELICKICGEPGHFSQGCPATLKKARTQKSLIEKVFLSDTRLPARIIGTGGAVIKGIQNDTNCKLKIDTPVRPDDEPLHVRIVGDSVEDVQKAKEAVLKIVSTWEKEQGVSKFGPGTLSNRNFALDSGLLGNPLGSPLGNPLGIPPVSHQGSGPAMYGSNALAEQMAYLSRGGSFNPVPLQMQLQMRTGGFRPGPQHSSSSAVLGDSMIHQGALHALSDSSNLNSVGATSRQFGPSPTPSLPNNFAAQQGFFSTNPLVSGDDSASNDLSSPSAMTLPATAAEPISDAAGSVGHGSATQNPLTAGLEERFRKEIAEVSEKFNQLEEEEHERHRDCLKKLKAERNEQLEALKGDHALQRAEFEAKLRDLVLTALAQSSQSVRSIQPVAQASPDYLEQQKQQQHVGQSQTQFQLPQTVQYSALGTPMMSTLMPSGSVPQDVSSSHPALRQLFAQQQQQSAWSSTLAMDPNTYQRSAAQTRPFQPLSRW